MVRVLHLAAANRWTGAAAPAFAEAEALRAAGVEAHYAYVGGYKLEARIGAIPWTHAVIEKAQNPAAFVRSVRAVRALIRAHAIDVVHAHLTYDHWLARTAIRGTGARLARTFHSRRVLRRDPLTRSLIGATAHLFVINEGFRGDAALRGRPAVFTPPPLDLSQFVAEGPHVRSIYGIDPSVHLLVVIGKVSPGRGFEAALQTFASLRRRRSDVRLMIIGHGEHRASLEAMARDLDIVPDVTWAGYHEVDLAEHYRAANVMLFTARGSDEGHRAVLEGMGCGLVPAVFPVEGMAALVAGTGLMAAQPSPDELATLVEGVLGTPLAAMRSAAIARARDFGYGPAARRLLDGYASV